MAHNGAGIPRILRETQGCNCLHADVVSNTRSLHRVDQLDEQWLLPCMTATSQGYTVVAVLPNEYQGIDRARSASFPACYRWPAYHLRDKDYAVDREMGGDDRPCDVRLISVEPFDCPARSEILSASTG
jgi:hypothetical protein